MSLHPTFRITGCHVTLNRCSLKTEVDHGQPVHIGPHYHDERQEKTCRRNVRIVAKPSPGFLRFRYAITLNPFGRPVTSLRAICYGAYESDGMDIVILDFCNSVLNAWAKRFRALDKFNRPQCDDA
jgi:hypothetical protein